jgi:hypothetical protein
MSAQFFTAVTQYAKYLLDEESFEAASSSKTVRAPQPRCKNAPSDHAWPPPAAWTFFNASVEDILFKTLPPAVSCHKSFECIPAYDAAKCAEALASWVSQPC